MKPIIIAEAATNHGGDLSMAKEMVHAAKETGADYIKFQSWRLATMDHRNPAFESMKPKELSDDDHYALLNECQKAGIKFLTTCFDAGRVPFLASLGLNTIKVASTDVGSTRMLKELRKVFPRIFLSTGMSYSGEVKNAVEVLKEGEFHLLHCVSLYPTPPDRANLARINWLRTFTPIVGYSDHTLGTTAAKIAICMGATVIEKHFTLKRDPNNIFSNMSALPEDILEITTFARDHKTYMGQEEGALTEDEIKARETFIGRWGDNR